MTYKEKLQKKVDTLKKAYDIGYSDGVKNTISDSLVPGSILGDGYIYVGLMLSDDKKQTYHLAMVPEESIENYTWDKAIKTFGDAVPSLRECNLISSTGLITDNEWRWSSTEYSNTSSWIQRFNDGNQGNNVKGYGYRVRCVRRFGYRDA